MSADVLLDIDPLVIEELDAPIACEGEAHPTGECGHVPTDPAAYLQIIPGCACVPFYKCAGYVAWFLSTPGFMVCTRCRVKVRDEEIRFIPITESSS